MTFHEFVNWSFITVLGFTVAVVSLAIMLIISQKQEEQTGELHKQGNKIDGTTAKIEKTTDEIHKATIEIKKVQKEQHRLLTGVQDVYASAFVEYIQSISKSYAHVLNLYDRYKKAENITSELRQADRSNIISNYDNLLHDRRPKLDFIELVRSFGRELANKYWRNTPKLTAQD